MSQRGHPEDHPGDHEDLSPTTQLWDLPPVTGSRQGPECKGHVSTAWAVSWAWAQPSSTVSPLAPHLGNFGFILLFGSLEGLIMVPGTVVVHQLPASFSNA